MGHFITDHQGGNPWDSCYKSINICLCKIIILDRKVEVKIITEDPFNAGDLTKLESLTEEEHIQFQNMIMAMLVNLCFIMLILSMIYFSLDLNYFR